MSVNFIVNPYNPKQAVNLSLIVALDIETFYGDIIDKRCKDLLWICDKNNQHCRALTEEEKKELKSFEKYVLIFTSNVGDNFGPFKIKWVFKDKKVATKIFEKITANL